MKTTVGVLYVYFAFLACYVPNVIFLGTCAITGPNIVMTNFQIYSLSLVFFNSLLNAVVYCWRMRYIRHAMVATLPWLYTNRESWFWIVKTRVLHLRGMFMFQFVVIFRAQIDFHLGFFQFGLSRNSIVGSVQLERFPILVRIKIRKRIMNISKAPYLIAHGALQHFVGDFGQTSLSS